MVIVEITLNDFSSRGKKNEIADDSSFDEPLTYEDILIINSILCDIILQKEKFDPERIKKIKEIEDKLSEAIQTIM